MLILHQTNNYNSDSFQFIWNIYANNDVVVPTGGCDVSARDVTVTLPDYPGSMAVPLTVHCAQSQQLGYYLSGTTADSANAIFTNTASASPAQDRRSADAQRQRRRANSTVSLGTVGTSPVNLGLTATYARTTGGYRRQRAVDHRHHLCLSMMTDYILSPCSLAARGLSQLMLNAAKRPVELPVEGVSLRELAAVKRIVVYLLTILWMLTTLRRAARLLDEALPPLPMLILSRSPAIWLWQTLLYQVSHPDRLHNVHTAPADLSCAELAHRLENAPRLERLAGEAALIHGKRVVGLTHAELKVILALLQGQTIGEQAQRLGLSQKTLYTQRLAGVKSWWNVIRIWPRFPRTLLPRSPANALTAFEQEWVQAIHDRRSSLFSTYRR